MMSNEVSGAACVTETIDIAHVPGVHPSEWSRGFGITNLSNSLEFYIGAGSMQLASMMRQERKGVVMNPALEAMMPTARFETNVLASPPPDPCFAPARRPVLVLPAWGPAGWRVEHAQARRRRKRRKHGVARAAAAQVQGGAGRGGHLHGPLRLKVLQEGAQEGATLPALTPPPSSCHPLHRLPFLPVRPSPTRRGMCGRRRAR